MTIDPELLDDLRDPRAYPHVPSTVEVVQTHISCVFLAGDDVFKVKKPVRFSFLDFTTLERRRHFCDEEVRLNRRLAPEVYRGVVPIVRGADGHRIGGRGEPVEYAVHMRRLPQARLLRALVERGEADDALMERIAVKMAAFHAHPDTEPASTESAAPEEIARTLRETFTGLATNAGRADGPLPVGERAGDAPPDGGVAALDDLRLLTESALARVAETLRRRCVAGRVRDGHGDLRPDHICCTETLPIIDCVEFSLRLRTCDVASEIAFLASELEFLDAQPLADALISAYVHASGDDDLRAVLPFFRAYRAEVRAMVAALTAAEPEVDAAQCAQQRDDVRRYLALAARCAWRAQGPFLLVIMGRSGSGKSTVAAALANATGLPVLRSDVLRKRLAGMAPLARPATDDAAARLYAPAHSAAVYAALVADAAPALASGRGVILDATFQRRDDRDRVRTLAAYAGVPLFWIVCRAEIDTMHARLRARAARDDEPSDATPAIADEQGRRFEPLTEGDEPRLSLTTDEDRDPAATARRWLVHRLGVVS
ncbi:MAG: AAA family ATPase [Deltaproteobacteria bacterium]|nr:AAA family ATPase [Deltaproteobacteria bacterium]